jgi:uncharacterized protein
VRTWPDSIDVELALDDIDSDDALRRATAAALRVAEKDMPTPRILRRVIDARRGNVRFQMRVAFTPAPDLTSLGLPRPQQVTLPARVVVVGDGPCGLFCAYELARHGIACTVIDRGKTVQPRRIDLRNLNQENIVNEDSNYCHGEGGAGTYSDGKLWTRSTKRGEVKDVLEILAFHDAPIDILTEGRPHIGSNLLPKVVTAMREFLESVGVRFLFEHRVTSIETAGQNGSRHVTGVRLASTLPSFVDGLACDAVVVATGHSARDIYAMLHDMHVLLEPKAFALGVRIEHPQPFINKQQYGRHFAHKNLPNAAYRIAHTTDDGGVFSFCMCPGGFMVPASTDASGLVVNGMSLKRRDSPYANSGFVASVSVEDASQYGFSGPMGLLRLQSKIETACKTAGGGTLRAPATRASDFVRGKATSQPLTHTSYQPGLTSTDLAPVLDAAGPGIARRLRQALQVFDKQIVGYAGDDAIMVGVESRTSAPVRIVRDDATLQSPSVRGLYPGGEGAGYAGGIVSAAIDGMNIAKAIARAAASQ